MSGLETLIKISLACLLGGLVGMERESLKRPAGFKTYTFVCVGSALAMIVSVSMMQSYHFYSSADPGRIAAQVISGIGFLGAGTIIREGPSVIGLTTASGLWVVACIGLAVGAGLYMPAIFTTCMILFVLLALNKIEARISGVRAYKMLTIVISNSPEVLGSVTFALGKAGISIKDMDIRDIEGENLIEVDLRLDLPLRMTIRDVEDMLTNTGCPEIVDIIRS